jgi:hypothetical protein
LRQPHRNRRTANRARGCSLAEQQRAQRRPAAELPAELARLVALARVAGWPVCHENSDAVAIELPGRGYVAVIRNSGPSGGWHLMAAVDALELPARDAFDLASLLAELFAGRTVWPLHQDADLYPRLVEQDAEDAA